MTLISLQLFPHPIMEGPNFQSPLTPKDSLMDVRIESANPQMILRSELPMAPQPLLALAPLQQ
jgi:hypothetical protein